jgi:serine/threonine protein kinase
MEQIITVFQEQTARLLEFGEGRAPPVPAAGRASEAIDRQLAQAIFRSSASGLGYRTSVQTKRAVSTSPSMANILSTVICGIAVGLGFVHSRGVIHGNLTPENVMTSAKAKPRITGFRPAAFALESLPIDSERALFTAPEVHDGERSPAADVYRFACLA